MKKTTTMISAATIFLLMCGCVNVNKWAWTDESNNLHIALDENTASCFANDDLIVGSRFNDGRHIQLNFENRSKTKIERIGLFCIADGGSTLYSTEYHSSKYTTLLKDVFGKAIPEENTMFLNKGTNGTKDENGIQYQCNKDNFLKFLDMWIEKLNSD